MVIKVKHCARCGQVAVRSQVTEDGVDFDVYTCPSHKEVVWKEKTEKEPEAAIEPAAEVKPEPEAPRKREPKALN